MKTKPTLIAFATLLSAAGLAHAEQQISTAADRPTTIGSTDYFTGM